MTAVNDITNGDDAECSVTSFTVFIIPAYLLFVYLIGPRMMKDKPAFKLKKFMCIYNILQVLSCLYLIDRMWKLASWDIFNTTKCKIYSPNTDKEEYKLYIDLVFKIYLLKVFELTDTVIFVLRKKQRQISFLHVFHHSSTITVAWLPIHYFKSSANWFSVYLNTWVHVVMYSYYFFANVCSAETMKKFTLIKKCITITQMVQFVLVLIQAVYIKIYCQIHSALLLYYVCVVIIIFYGFYDFYKKSYSNNLNSKIKK